MKKIQLEKILNTSAITFITLVSSTIYSQVAQAAEATSTYFGADAVVSKMKFKENYGNNIFSQKMTPGMNLFVGHMFNDNWGAEIGYEFEKKMKRTETINGENTVAGVPMQLRFSSYNTTIKQHHPYIGAIAKTNVWDNNNFVSLMLGVSVSHIQARYNNFADSIGAQDVTRTFSRTKPVATLRASFEHRFNNQFGLRVLSTWRNTSKIKVKSEENSSSAAEIKLKNSIGLGVGISYYIS